MYVRIRLSVLLIDSQAYFGQLHSEKQHTQYTHKQNERLDSFFSVILQQDQLCRHSPGSLQDGGMAISGHFFSQDHCQNLTSEAITHHTSPPHQLQTANPPQAESTGQP